MASLYSTTLKRVFDFILTCFLLLLCLPTLLVIGVLTLLFMGKPVLFQQNRPGLHGEIYRLLKFRTMTNAVDKRGRILPDAQRLTRFGRFLRRTSLDELPQLWNVVKGDMSLVGPRPLLAQYLDRYTKEQARRHNVRPGITGWTQVNGRNNLSWEEKFEMDVWYVDHLSPALDLKILFRTLAVVCMGQGIHQPGEATVEEFTGETKAKRLVEPS